MQYEDLEKRWRNLQQKGYLYITFCSTPYCDKYERERLRTLKSNGFITDYKTIHRDIYTYYFIKPTFKYYKKLLNDFIDKFNKFYTYFFTRKGMYMRNPFATSVWERQDITISNAYRYILDDFNELVQIILYNKAGFRNPNLTDEEFNILNKKLLELDKMLKNIKKVVIDTENKYKYTIIDRYRDAINRYYSECMSSSDRNDVCYYNRLLHTLLDNYKYDYQHLLTGYTMDFIHAENEFKKLVDECNKRCQELVGGR